MSKTKSRAQRELAGTERPGRIAADDKPADAPLPEKPPSWISQGAANDYRRLQPQLEGISTAKDVDTLAAYCADLALYRKLSQQCVNVTDTFEVDSRGNERASAVFDNVHEIASRLDRRAKALGLTPESRGVKAPAPAGDEKPTNPWDDV